MVSALSTSFARPSARFPAGLSGVAACCGDPVERGTERGDEGDGGGVGGLAGFGVFALFAEVEVVARVVGGFHAIPGALGDGEVGEAGGDHDGFLRAADENVDAPGVHVEVGGAEAGDGVDDEQGLGTDIFEQLGDAGGAVADAGGGLGGLHEDDAGFELEGGPDLVEREGLAVGGGDDVDGAAEVFGEGGPALAELAGGEDEDAVAGAGEVRDMAASMAPVPEEERRMTSFLVPTNCHAGRARTRV